MCTPGFVGFFPIDTDIVNENSQHTFKLYMRHDSDKNSYEWFKSTRWSSTQPNKSGVEWKATDPRMIKNNIKNILASYQKVSGNRSGQDCFVCSYQIIMTAFIRSFEENAHDDGVPMDVNANTNMFITNM